MIDLLAADKTCKEIASLLALSARTVEHHVERLKRRSRHSTLHGMMAFLVGQGFISSLG